MTPLLALGPHVFEIAPLNFQEIVRDTEIKWPSISRFGGRPGRQFTGYGEDPITISGLLYPEELGGRDEFEAIKVTAKSATPVIMMGWSSTIATAAKVFGRVVILRVGDTQTAISRSGQARRISYDIEVAPFPGDGKPVGLF